MKTLAEKIAVMQAAERGEVIEMKCLRLQNHHKWQAPKHSAPQWNWAKFDYRVKPKEPREFYVYISKVGILGDKNCPASYFIRHARADIGRDETIWEEIKVREIIEE